MGACYDQYRDLLLQEVRATIHCCVKNNLSHVLRDTIPFLTVPFTHGKPKAVLTADALFPFLKTPTNFTILAYDGTTRESLILENVKEIQVCYGGAQLLQLDGGWCPRTTCHTVLGGDLKMCLHRRIAEEISGKL